jgi:hypothetical protein
MGACQKSGFMNVGEIESGPLTRTRWQAGMKARAAQAKRCCRRQPRGSNGTTIMTKRQERDSEQNIG